MFHKGFFPVIRNFIPTPGFWRMRSLSALSMKRPIHDTTHQHHHLEVLNPCATDGGLSGENQFNRDTEPQEAHVSWPDYPALLRRANHAAHEHPSNIRIIDSLACVEEFWPARPWKKEDAHAVLKPVTVLQEANPADANIMTYLWHAGYLYESTCTYLLAPPQLTFFSQTAEAIRPVANTWTSSTGLTPTTLCLPGHYTPAVNNFHVLHHELWHAALPVGWMHNIGHANIRHYIPDALRLPVNAGEQAVTSRFYANGIDLTRPVPGLNDLLHSRALNKYHSHISELIADCGALMEMAHFELSQTRQLRETPALLDTLYDLRAASHVQHMLTRDAITLGESSDMSYATHMAMPYLRVRLYELAIPNPKTGTPRLLEFDMEDFRHEVIQCALQGLQPNEFADMLIGARWLQAKARHEGIEFGLDPLSATHHLRHCLATDDGPNDDIRHVCDDLLARGQTALERLSGGNPPSLERYITCLRERADFVGPEHTRLLIDYERARIQSQRDKDIHQPGDLRHLSDQLDAVYAFEREGR